MRKTKVFAAAAAALILAALEVGLAPLLMRVEQQLSFT